MKLSDIEKPIMIHSLRRVSSTKQKEEGLSLPVQKKENERRAKEDGLEINYNWEIDESGSRGIGKERKKYAQLRQVIQGTDFYHIILMEKFDRISRNEDDRVALSKLIKAGRIEIRITRDNTTIDKNNLGALGTFTYKVVGAVSEYWSDYVSEEVRKGQKEKLSRSEYLGRIPIGYKSIPKTKKKPQEIVQTSMAPRVKQFLELYSSGKFSLNQAVKLAKDIGLKNEDGNFLSRSSVTGIIKRRFYYGEFEVLGVIYQNKTKSFVPLITKKTWEKCQQATQKRSRVRDGRQKHFFKFNGILTCGKCDRQFYGAQDQYPVKWKKADGTVAKKKYKYAPKYVCSYGPVFTTEKGIQIEKEYIDKHTLTVKEDVIRTYDGQLKDGEWVEKKNRIAKKGEPVIESKCNAPSISEKEITDHLLEQIGLLKFNNKSWQNLKGQIFADESKEFIDFEIKTLRSEQTKLETESKVAWRDWHEKKIDDALYQSIREENKKRLDEIKATLAELSADSESYEDKLGKSIKIVEAMKSFRDKWEKADDEKRNLIVKLITIKIFVDTQSGSANSLKIVWTPEFNQLFELGIIEKSKDDGQFGGGFNGKNRLYTF